MYFSSFDFPHIFFVSSFLLIVFWMIFFRSRKYFLAHEKATNYSINKRFTLIRFISLILSIFLIGIVFLGPVGLMRNSSTSTDGIDCVWLLDVSTSMDVRDVSENSTTISRIARSKSVIENFMISHPENRYGLIIFAGASRLVSPLTSDHSSLLTFLVSIDSRSISTGGTDFLDALKLATERFETKDNTTHAIVLLSDGGDMEDSPNMSSIKSVLQEENIILSTVGIGKTKPSPIPIGTNPFGDTVYKKFGGEIVLSGLNRESLRNLADVGKWTYIEGTSLEKDLGNSLNSITRHNVAVSWDNTNDKTVPVLVMISFFFFLVFLLFPSSFLKRWNVL